MPTDNAYAKINLTLDIVGKRPDGYHLLETVMQTVSLCDAVSVEPYNGIEVSCSAPDVPTGPENTCHKAARLFFEHTMIAGGAKIHIEKHIPSQAGLGGGSSDAATVIKLLNLIYGVCLSDGELERIAAKVGADAAFFIRGGAAVCRGIGENIEPLPKLPQREALLVKPDFGVSTPEAYRLFDEKGTLSQRGTAGFLKALKSGGNPYFELSNDLENSADDKRIEKIRGELNGLGAEASLMSGSGSCVFGLFEKKETAETAKLALMGKYPFICLCGTI